MVELKVTEKLKPRHQAQAYSYVKAVDKQVGLLFNFGGQAPEFNRIYFNPAKRASAPVEKKVELPPDDWLYPELTYKVIGGVYEVHNVLGAGFVHRLYTDACYHELRLLGMEVKLLKRLQIAYKGEAVGDIAFGHLLVDGKLMVFPVALQYTRDIKLDNLKRWMRQNGIKVGILANFDPAQLEVVTIRLDRQ